MTNLEKIMQEIKKLETLLSSSIKGAGINTQRRQETVPVSVEVKEDETKDEIIDIKDQEEFEIIENNEALNNRNTLGGDCDMEEKRPLDLNFQLPDLGCGGENPSRRHRCEPCCIPCIPCQPCNGEGLEGLEICTGAERTVENCCSEVVLDDIELAAGQGVGRRRLIFDVRDLECRVERCILFENDRFVGVRWALKVVGCIPYTVSIPVRGAEPGVCVDPGESFAYVCCTGKACVDTTVRLFETFQAANECCARDIECRDVRAEVVQATIDDIENCEGSLLRVRVAFTFDTCFRDSAAV